MFIETTGGRTIRRAPNFLMPPSQGQYRRLRLVVSRKIVRWSIRLQSASDNILTSMNRLGKKFGSPDLKGIPNRLCGHTHMAAGTADFL